MSCHVPRVLGAPPREDHVVDLLVAVRHQDFLLERAIFNRHKLDSSRLVASAKSLLALVTKAYNLKDSCWQFKCNITDMVLETYIVKVCLGSSANTRQLAFHGVPPAGVLAMEMLKRDSVNDPNDTFPRSETLQQLCVLVGALEGVSKDEGNYNVCAMGLSAIKKVLDRLLSRPLPRQVASDSLQHQGLVDDPFGVYIDNDADFLQWMDSVDFDTSLWDPTHGQVNAS